LVYVVKRTLYDILSYSGSSDSGRAQDNICLGWTKSHRVLN